MIRRERVINKLTDCGYLWTPGGTRNDVFKRYRDGGISYASVVKHDFLEVEYVRKLLHQAGCDIDEIETFLTNNQAAC